MWLCMVFAFMVVTLVPHTKSVHTPSIVLDDPCTYDTECKYDFAYCYDRAKCACRKHYAFYQKINNCVLECSSETGCPNGNFTCPGLHCKCDKHYISKGQNCTIRERVHLGENCAEVEECIESNTTKIQCLQNICSCDNGYRHIGNDTCQPGVLGEPCKLNNECDLHNGTAFCSHITGTCQCKDDFVLSKNQKNTCLKVAKLLDSCIEDIQCTSNHSKCEDKKCICRKGYRLENDSCIRSAEVGENCTTTKDCNPLGGTIHCNNGTCSCRSPKFVRSINRPNNCLKASEYKAHCEEPHQCPRYSTCMRSTCRCQTGYMWRNNTCKKNVAYWSRENSWMTTIICITVHLWIRQKLYN